MSSEDGQRWRSSSPSRNIPAGAATLAPGIYNPMGFDQTADNHMYESLRAKVMAEERERRISQGLPPDPPSKTQRFKNWLLNRDQQPTTIVGADSQDRDNVQRWPSFGDKRSSKSSDRRRSSAITKTTTAETTPEVDLSKVRASIDKQSAQTKRVDDWWA